MMIKLAFALLISASVSSATYAVEPQISPNAPPDKPNTVYSLAALEKSHQAMQPYVEIARRTYPAAKARYQKGLPRGQSFFVTTRLHDAANREEQVFIAVTSIENGIIHGIIFNDIEIVSGFRNKQPYAFPETDLIDWLITKPDGSEEGNVVGKFMDTYHPE